MEVIVERTENTPDGVFGVMHIGNWICHTVEDDWKNNEPGESCIPDGEYKLHRTIYYGGGYETFEIMNVPNRSRILIHVANTEEDVKGCIGLGMSRGFLRVRDEDNPAHPWVLKRAVTQSKKAFHQFMDAMGSADDGVIKIRWAAYLP